MSYHLEWATTADTSIALYRKGRSSPATTNPSPPSYGLLLGGGVIIEGTKP